MTQHEIGPNKLSYAPDKLERRPDIAIDFGPVVGAINLGTKRIAGFKSKFLILGALDPDGRVRLLSLEEGVEPGAPIA